MPNMQRLTGPASACTRGICPATPPATAASACRMISRSCSSARPRTGGTVVVGDGKVPVPHLASNPGLLLAPKDFTPEMLRPLAQNDYDWNPERSASGPITMVVSAADKAIYVYRNGKPIGRAPVEISGRGSLGDHVFSLLEGTTGRQSSLAPGREARRWMSVTSSGRSVDAEKIASRLRINPEFADKVYDTSRRARPSSSPISRSCGAAATPRSLRVNGLPSDRCGSPLELYLVRGNSIAGYLRPPLQNTTPRNDFAICLQELCNIAEGFP